MTDPRLPDRLLTVADLQSVGVSTSEAQRLVRRHVLHRLCQGIYVPLAWWSRLDDDARALQMHHAVARSALEPPVFCYDSAALIHGWRLLRRPARPHVLAPAGKGTRSTGRLAAHHTGTLPSEDVGHVGELSVTTRARTALDCARFLPQDAAVVIMDQALRAGVVREELAERIADLPGHRGVHRAGQALQLADPLAESPAETLTRLVLVRHRLPPFVCQLPVDTPFGVFRADFAWPRARLILEFDGQVKYTGEQPTDQVLLAERRREKALTNAGWRVVRTDWPTITRFPERLVALLRRELALRGSADRSSC